MIYFIYFVGYFLDWLCFHFNFENQYNNWLNLKKILFIISFIHLIYYFQILMFAF